MNLLDLIKAHASEQATAGNFSDVATILNSATETTEDHTYYTSRKLVTELGVDAYRIVSGTLAAIGEQDPLVKDFHQMLNSTGLPFADPMTQAMLDQIGAVAQWPAPLIAQLKEIGIKTESPAQKHLGGAVTEQECQAAWMADYLLAVLRDRHANARLGLQAGTITTIDQLHAVLTGA